MKSVQFLVLFSLFGVSPLFAQWKTEQFTLRGGWSTIYLHGDADHVTVDELFMTGDAANILEIWRWNANPEGAQFITSSDLPSVGTPDWSVWRRGDPTQNDTTFNRLLGQHAYLIYCSGHQSNVYTVSIQYRPTAPSQEWVRAGANLIGLPATADSPPTISKFFEEFPAAVASNAKIFRYNGGELGVANPLQVFAPVVEPLDRTQAYWFESQVVGSYHGPLGVKLVGGGHIDFGATRSLATLRLKNHRDSIMTVTLEPMVSEPAPIGQDAVAGSVPLTLRTLNEATLEYEVVPLTAATQLSISGNKTLEVGIGVDRGAGAMAGAALTDVFGSLLCISDDQSVSEIELGVSAKPASLSGLWLGEAVITEVSSVLANDLSGTAVRDPMRMRVILHQGDDGQASLLSQVFVGVLDNTNQVGVCSQEALLDPERIGTATRYTAAHLPLDQVIANGSGSMAVPGTLTRIATIAFNDPTNPFVHQYHPDHDNLDARYEPLPAGVEAPAITRTSEFTFTTSPPSGGSPPSGWGVTSVGGIYREILSGLHSTDIEISGTFNLRRISDDGHLATP